MARRLLFSVTRDDFEMQTFCAGGKGGQNQNSVNSGVRLIHRASGARGEARDSRDQHRNKTAAFVRLLATPQWKAWHKAEVARRLGVVSEPEVVNDAAVRAQVDASMTPEHVRVELMTPNGWEVEA